MFRRKRTSRDFAAEIEAHIELEAERLQEQGLSPDQARAAAYRTFGNATRAQERFYESQHPIWWDNFLQDVSYAQRMLRKAPGFTATAILTIALGIGATAAIFSVVDATLLHPLPYPNPEQLVSIEDDLPGLQSQNVGMSEPEWLDLQHSGVFEFVSPTWYDDNNLTGSSQPQRVSLSIVAPNYFALLGVKPQLGRTFDPGNHAPGFTTEIVISDGLWKRAFGGDPGVLGKSLRLDTDLYHVVGVMPPEFHSPGPTTRERNIEVWAAMSFYGAPLPDNPPRSSRYLPTAVARLKSGLTIADAQRKIDALVAALQKKYPADYPAQNRWRIRLIPLREMIVGNVRESLILLLGAVGMVLLIGCVNVANLMLARASARGREMGVRQALGATRSRILRQLLTESLLLSLTGGIAGLAILFCAKEFLLRLLPEALPRLNTISISWTVLLFAVVATITSGVFFGLAPSFHAGRLELMHVLKQDTRGSTDSGEQAGTRRSLVVTEFALSLVLMIAAGLLLHSFWDLVNARLGFNPQSVMTIKTRLPFPNDQNADVYRTPAQKARLSREVLRRCKALPGVEEVAMGDLGSLPLAHDRTNQTPPKPLILSGHEAQSNQAPLVDDSIVSPEYFYLMGMTLLRGRLFRDFDKDDTPAVAVINEAAALTYWPKEDALEKRFKLSFSDSSWTTVVGIVADARTESLENSRVPQIYLNLYQKGAKHLAIFLRGPLDIGAIPEQVRKQVQAVDPTLPVFEPKTLNETLSRSLAQRRFSMEIVALFALTALLLAGLGTYGVISYLVSERTHEFGIRLALGASRRNILRMVLRQGLGLAIAGASLGLIAALVVSYLMSGLLYGVKPIDPITFGGVAVLLIVVSLIASYVPARQAIRVDPMDALRCE